MACRITYCGAAKSFLTGEKGTRNRQRHTVACDPKRTSAEQWLGYLVGGNEHGLRNHHAERFGRLEIGDQLEFDRLHYRRFIRRSPLSTSPTQPAISLVVERMRTNPAKSATSTPERNAYCLLRIAAIVTTSSQPEILELYA